MASELRPEIIAPPNTYLGRTLAVAAGAAVVGIGVWLATPAALVQSPIAMTLRDPVPVSSPSGAVVAMDAVPAVASDQVALVFTAGGASYIKLASLGGLGHDDGDAEAVPRHGSPTLVEDDYVMAAVAPVQARDVPAAHRGWSGRRVIVDGGCVASVTGFAVVARLTGDPGYAGSDEARWRVGSVMEYGAPVLAARLDGCAGVYARDASLAPIVVPQQLDEPALAAAARRSLVASAASAEAQREWRAAGMDGRWYASDDAEATTHVVRHPITGVTWVSIHLRNAGGCGSPELGVWGLYRASTDGALTQVASSLGELLSIEQLVDLEGDGDLEVIGNTWTGSRREIIRRTGEPVQRLDVPFYGCGC